MLSSNESFWKPIKHRGAVGSIHIQLNRPITLNGTESTQQKKMNQNENNNFDGKTATGFTVPVA